MADNFNEAALDDTTGDPVEGECRDRNLSRPAEIEAKPRQFRINSRTAECPMSFLQTRIDSVLDFSVPNDQKTYNEEMCKQKKNTHWPKLWEANTISYGAA